MKDMIFRKTLNSKPEKVPEITKWWLLKNEKAEKQELGGLTINMKDDSNAICKPLSEAITRAANKTLGHTKPS